jgi:hypothetical protein
MVDPIDFYLTHKITPKVTRFQLGLFPSLNGIFIDHAPILFEKGDHLDVKYSIQRVGKLNFTSYMGFLHEVYKQQNMALENEYSGTWSFKV